MTNNITLYDDRFNYSRKGFCAIVTQLLYIISEHNSFYGDTNICIGDSQLLELFDNLNTVGSLDYNPSGRWLDVFFTEPDKLVYTDYNAHMPANAKVLSELNFCLRNTLRIKPNILSEFTNLFDRYITSRTMGVQIRGTDKVSEIPPIADEDIISHINYELDNDNIDNIFLSTDDVKYVKLLTSHFGGRVVYNESNIISNNEGAIHFNQKHNKSRVNYEVLSNAYLLSKCKTLLYCYSNVSQLALIMGINELNKIKLLN